MKKVWDVHCFIASLFFSRENIVVFILDRFNLFSIFLTLFLNLLSGLIFMAIRRLVCDTRWKIGYALNFSGRVIGAAFQINKSKRNLTPVRFAGTTPVPSVELVDYRRDKVWRIKFDVYRIDFNGTRNGCHNCGGGFFIANVVLDNESRSFACLSTFSKINLIRRHSL